MPANGSVSKVIMYVQTVRAVLYVACCSVSELEYCTQFVESDISLHIVYQSKVVRQRWQSTFKYTDQRF